MQLKKITAGLLSVLLAGALLAGCSTGETASSNASQQPASSAAAEKTKVNVFGIKGPTGIGLVNLMKANEEKTAQNDYTFSVLSTPDEAVAKVASGEADIAAVPTNLASALYAKTNGKVKMLAVNTLGVLYILENGTAINSVKDLKGKTIYSTGQGANPEYVLRYVLEKNGLDPDKDVKLEFLSENDELATQLASGKAGVALVPEPVVTTVLTKNDKLRVALDMTKEWKNAAGDESTLMMGCVVARSAFVEKNPQAVKAFLSEYKASIEKATGDVDGTAALCETYGIIPKAAVAKQAIPRCNLTYVDGQDMMKQIKVYFDVLFAAKPASIGGKLPDDSLYYLG